MARKQLNKNLVIAMSLAGFALILVLSVLMLRQLQQGDPKYFVELAKRAEGEGQWKQAAIFYGQAWDRSQDASFLVPLGEALLNNGEVNLARDWWNHALVHQPDLMPAHERRIRLMLDLAEMYGSTDNWNAVKMSSEAMLGTGAEKTAQQEAFARHALGLALVHLAVRDAQNAELGMQELQKAATLAPDEADYSIDIAAQHERRGSAADAAAQYKSLLERYSTPGQNGAEARRAYAEHLARQQKFDEAAEMFEESIEYAQADPATLAKVRLAHSGFLMQRWARARVESSDAAQAFFDESERILRELIAGDPDAFKPYLQLALLYKASARFQDVVSVTDERLGRGLSRKGVEAAQNRISAFTLMIYASEACVALALEAGRDGQLDSKEQWLTKAEQFVVDAKGEAANHPRVISQAGRVKLARGQDRGALEDLRAADDAYRSVGMVNWENKLILADTHLRLAEPGAAKAALEEVRELALRERPRDPLFWNLYAQSLLQSNELDRALAVADRVLMFDAKNPEAALIKAAVYERQKKFELAGDWHRQATQTVGIESMLRARAASMDGRNEEAVAILKEALQKEPGNAQVLGMAVHELVDLKRHAEAGQLVAEALKLSPEDRVLKQLAVYARTDLSEDERDQALIEAIGAEPDAYKRALDLVMFHSRRTDYTKALSAVDEALRHIRERDTPMAKTATESQHGALLKTKVRLAGQLDDETALASARDEAAEYDVDGADGKSVLGLYHMQRREFELAIHALREAVAAQPSDAVSLTMLGQCYHVQGRSEDARNAYQRAVTANRELGLAHQGLAALAKARGDEEAYRAELEICRRLNPDDSWVQEQLLIETEEKDPAAAIARREAAQKAKPDDAYNVQRLAALYEKMGNRESADAAYARIRELLPNDARSFLLSAAYFRRTNRPDRAIELLTGYVASQTGEARTQAVRILANEYVEQNKLEAAEKTLLDAAVESPDIEIRRAVADFYIKNADKPAEATEWYTRAIDEAVRRNSAALPGLLEARILARLHRSVNDFDGARADVEVLQKQFPAFARGALWDSEIHARTGDIDAAVASLSAYLGEHPDDVYALYQRARHHVATGAIGLAVGDLEALKRVNPAALQYEPRVLLARLHRRTTRNDLWIRELESIMAESPGETAVAQELADGYIQLKRLDDADRLVTAQLNRASAESKGRWHFLRGQISLALDQRGKAIADFEQGAAADDFAAASVARVLSLYAQANEYARGLQYFEGIRSRVAPSVLVGSRQGLLLAKAGREGEAVEQFRQSMALALSREPRSSRIVSDDLQSAFPNGKAIELLSSPPADPVLVRANDRLLVRVYAVAGKYDQANGRLDALIASAATDSERAGLLHEKGTVLQLAQKHDESIAAYERAIEYDRNDWMTLNNLAYALSDFKGENELALPYAKRAVAIADNSYTLDTLGWIYVGLGQYPAAIAELSRAIRQDPDYAWAYYHLGEAHRRNGQFDQAADVLRSGRDVAGAADDLVKVIDESLAKVAKSDGA